MTKDAGAVALGRRGGLKGGRARAESLSPLELSESGKRAAAARWARPVAEYGAPVVIGDISLPSYVLNDERRILSQTGMITALGMSRGGQGTTDLGSDRLARFVQGKAISPFVSEDLRNAIVSPIEFRIPGNPGKPPLGYEATILADLCEAILKAREAKQLQKQQEGIAARAELLVRGFARVGIVALVDEATGYQYARARRGLAEILELFIAKELAAWAKTFDDDFYRELFRLRGDARVEITNKKPGYIGKLTNDIVYARLAPGVLEELRKKNPRTESGHRRAKHHQHLTPYYGHPKLREHLAKVTTLMQVSPDYDTFEQHLNRLSPRFGDTLEMFPPERTIQPPSKVLPTAATPAAPSPAPPPAGPSRA